MSVAGSFIAVTDKESADFAAASVFSLQYFERSLEVLKF